MSYQEMLFTFLGGLEFSFFGIKYLGDGLQKAAGNRLREYQPLHFNPRCIGRNHWR